MSEIDYLQLAKDRISEVDGNHEIAWVNCKLNVAIADALVALVEELRKLNHAMPNHCREEIVRCGDCSLRAGENSQGVDPYYCELHGIYGQPDSFCAWAERKGDAE